MTVRGCRLWLRVSFNLELGGKEEELGEERSGAGRKFLPEQGFEPETSRSPCQSLYHSATVRCPHPFVTCVSV